MKSNQSRILPRRSKELAELTGIVLGDGNIFQFARCQRLTVSCNGSYRNYIKHVVSLIKRIFKKEPTLMRKSKGNCIDVRLYMQDIDKALELSTGGKLKNSAKIPEWIFKKKAYLMKCLKGLFETDGHYGLSRKFYVEYMQFCNKSKSLRESVYKALISLDYSPQLGSNYVRLARKAEVHRFIDDIGFERPFPSLVNY